MNQTEDGIDYNFKGNIGGVAILGITILWAISL